MSPIVRVAERTFGSLHVRNYRLFISGQLVSMTGTWMQTVALGWLVLELTDSGIAVGFNLALQFLPILLLGMWGGLLADRLDKRRILLWSQTALGALAMTLWVLTATEVVQVWMIYVVTLFVGLVTVVDNPTRQSFVTEMVGSENVPNAVSLNSAVFNASRIIGPALAGLLIATIGLSWTFLLNALSFGAVLAGLKAMRTSELFRTERAIRSRGQVREGFRYVWRTTRLRYTLMLVGVVSIFGLNFSVVLPLMARFTFHEGAGTYGLLTSMMAAGALIGALASAARQRPTKKVLVVSATLFGSLVLAASFAPNVTVLAVLLVPIGAASISLIAAGNATLQLTAAPEMRGRVMALHGLVFLGSTPLGAPLIGWISETWGPRAGLGVGGAASLAAALGAAVFVGRGRIERSLRPFRVVRRLPLTSELPDGLPEEDGPDVREVHPRGAALATEREAG